MPCCSRIRARFAVMLLAVTSFFSTLTSATIRAENAAGGHISFTLYNTTTRRADIYLIDSDGKNQVNLTESSGINTETSSGAVVYSWSPDGSVVALSIDESGVYLLDLDQSMYEVIDRDGFGPAWSPKGNIIAYTSMRDGNTEIYRTPGINLTRNTKSDYSPFWSPDGRIIFTSDREAVGYPKNYIMDSNGENVEEYTGPQHFSRDGRHSIVVKKISEGGVYKPVMYIRDLETGEERVAFDNPEMLSGGSQYESISLIALSPDGKQIAFVSNRNSFFTDGQTRSVIDLFVVNSDGSGRLQLTTNRYGDNIGLVDWRPSPVQTAVSESSGDAPVTFTLDPAHPNPFNPSTAVSFTLPAPGTVRLAVYNVTGRKVRELVSGRFAAGRHRALWDGRSDSGEPVSSGIYIARLEKDGQVRTSKMTLLK